MKTVNLLFLAQMSENVDVDIVPEYEKYLSGRKENIKIKAREITTINQLVMQMRQTGLAISCFDGFFYSYAIPQISKEFDLLKISDEQILDIELKSESVTIEKMEKQLIQNKHYLSHLSREIWLYAYDQETGRFYTLNGEKLQESTINEVAEKMVSFVTYQSTGIEKLFTPSMYLISPINNPNQFWSGAYFLTDGQEKIKEPIIKGCKNRTKYEFFSIRGAAGTGKSLLLYDIAKELSAEEKVCIIHCGMLSVGHYELNKLCGNFKIIAAKNVDGFDFTPYSYILIDEAHRIYKHQLKRIAEITKQRNMACVFSSDSSQVLSKREVRNNISQVLANMKKEHQFSLKEKIRSNREMASFIKKMFNLNTPVQTTEFEHIDIVAAHDYDEAEVLINYYKERGYTYIPYTMSRYRGHEFDRFIGKGRNTHEVIGQEFDRVVMVIDDSFWYNEKGELVAIEHPNPDYLFKQLLFQGVTRSREMLALIIIENKSVFETLLKIVVGKVP